MRRTDLLSALCLVTLSACAAEPGSPISAEGTPAALEQIDSWEGSGESLDVYFVPNGEELEDRIADAVMSATRSVRVAMYNLRSERLGHLLLERQRAGLEVEVLWDARQMALAHNTLDDELIAQGLHVTPILNERSAYATLHDKLAVIDGHQVFMGSANWGWSALHENDETILAFDSAALAAVVDAEMDEIVGGAPQPRTGDTDSRAQLYFAPGDRLDRVVESAIDGATDRIWIAVFSLRLDWLGDALVRAHRRGVDVRVITDRNQSETTSVDDRLREAGIEVIEARNENGAFTAMHQKFAVIDGRTTLVGSYNWTYTATMYNYEDLAVIADDPEVAAAFEGEIGRLWALYAPASTNPVTSAIEVDVDAFCDRTAWGDTLVLVGDAPELGSWNPHDGLRLDAPGWPRWTGRASLRPGARVQYKLVVVHADGSVTWEAGENRAAVIPTDASESFALGGDFRG
ncbi:MAG: hypothetical protein KC619_23105 [Myxococcales bacterium]|nr:hypothetical protein [Myxococcales bacterium]